MFLITWGIVRLSMSLLPFTLVVQSANLSPLYSVSPSLFFFP